MWFSVVCTLIDNDMRHHNGKKILKDGITERWNSGKCPEIRKDGTNYKVSRLRGKIWEREKSMGFVKPRVK